MTRTCSDNVQPSLIDLIIHLLFSDAIYYVLLDRSLNPECCCQLI